MYIKSQINNKIYVGKHSTNNLNDGYSGSGVALKKAYEKYGKENFNFEILSQHASSEDAFIEEGLIVDEEFIKRKDVYNLKVGGLGTKIFTDAMRKKISDKNTGWTTVKDVNGNYMRVKIDDQRYLSGELVGVTKGTTVSEETKDKISNSQKGKLSVKDSSGNIFKINNNDPRYLSGEVISENTGRLFTQSHKINLSKSLIGHKVTPETRKKISDRAKGRSMSEDTKRRISKSNKGKILVKDVSGNTMSVSKDDPRYLSGELVGITKGKILISHKINKLQKMIAKQDLCYYIIDGWIKGKLKKEI